MNVRPLFWMMVGAGATLVSGAWGGKQYLPIPGDLHQTIPSKTAIPMEATVNLNIDYAAENVLRRTPWMKPKADPFGEKPVIDPRANAPVVENREPPPLVFPFEYVGKLIADGKETFYLSKGDQIYPVAKGEILDSLYRIEDISSDSIELSYLPDSRKITITLKDITAKRAASAPTMPANGMMGSVVPPPSDIFSGARQPEMTQPTVDSQGMTVDMQPMMAPPPHTPSAAEEGQQSSATPEEATQPQVSMPPGMMPPGMIPPGAPQ